MNPQVPEERQVMVGAGVVRAGEDGPITFNNLASLRMHEQDACRAAEHRGFRNGVFAAGLMALAVLIFRMIHFG